MAKNFRLTISTDNEAFTEDRGAELARILTWLAQRFDTGVPGGEGTVRDSNGNTVGKWTL
jgi:hypothetical protein